MSLQSYNSKHFIGNLFITVLGINIYMGCSSGLIWQTTGFLHTLWLFCKSF